MVESKYWKVLVVEDDKTYQKIIRKALEKIDIVTISCTNGRMALEVLNDNEDVSLIITDIFMEEMDGNEFLERLRSKKKYQNFPTLIISGIASIDQFNSLLKHDHIEFLSKPFSADDIRNKIQGLLTR